MSTKDGEVDSAEFARILTKQVNTGVAECTTDAPLSPLPPSPEGSLQRAVDACWLLCVVVFAKFAPAEEKRGRDGGRESRGHVLLVEQ